MDNEFTSASLNNGTPVPTFICSNCRYSATYLIDGLCQNCVNLKGTNLPCFHGQIFSESQFNYKCPDCKGEFNNPSYGQGYSICLNAKCPWCGKEMKGI